MSEIEPYKRRDWDSNFLGYEVYSTNEAVRTATEICEILTDLKSKARLVYVSHSEPLDIKQTMGSFNGILADIKLTYAKKINPPSSISPDIKSYTASTASDRLIQLGLASGIYSRFRTDPKIGIDKYEAIYREWIVKSVSRIIASEVLVYELGGELTGMVTLGEKNNCADIGLIAVAENYRSHGIGRALMQAAENWGYLQGYTNIQVVTQRANIPACRLYEKNGYELIKEEYFYHFWL
ncbi:GNAT family N-acetyltransferase [Chitinophaga silvatica]|uniref:GNAT family N-acetyltransferase n=1 Tax=Chitinophaga silvatica TaxID=2282649 RepID=A0A3E1Y241_9BACT|nr:GNAT family N-acetyltransferase [Chitinophaga silvatica]RFS18731.1 GNAT family N-acetyltransferase [Chitinophaga silvatica]